MISPQAIISPRARLGKNVTVGPFSVIGDDVEIGQDSWIGPHVVIKGQTKIGERNKIFQFSSIGEDPQDKKYAGEKTLLEMGDDNIIRENCTLNRGTVQGGGVTHIGNNNLFMGYVHIAHDCHINNDSIFANNATLAGHVVVENYAILSGFTMVHQYCVIGAYSFVAAATGVTKDVLPYLMVSGHAHEANAYGLNSEGLRRRGFSPETIMQLKRAYKIIFRQNLKVPDAIEQLMGLLPTCPDIQLFITGLQASTRGITR